jgi:hypothetical protein
MHSDQGRIALCTQLKLQRAEAMYKRCITKADPNSFLGTPLTLAQYGKSSATHLDSWIEKRFMRASTRLTGAVKQSATTHGGG